jgi:molybdenum cofactor cytidylyltransferase
MITAIVLAGGASERMGRPKALLPFRGSTFLEVILQSCRSLPLAGVVVVAGPDIDKMLSDNILAGATKVLNPTPESGPIGSIRLGIGALDPTARESRSLCPAFGTSAAIR